jgi:hypothetical protein
VYSLGHIHSGCRIHLYFLEKSPLAPLS